MTVVFGTRYSYADKWSEPEFAEKLATARKDRSMWQTMDTAPKDGTNVLLYVPHMEPPIRTGRYWLHEDFRHGKLHYRHEGWQADGSTTMDASPKAWMPEPSAPDASLIA